MNRFMKICLAGLGVGAALCAAGAAAGGTLYSTLDGDGLHPWDYYLSRPGWDDPLPASRSGRSDSSGSVWEGERKPAREADGALEPLDPLDSLGDPERLEFDFGGGSYTIIEGDRWGIESGGDWLESVWEDGVWRLRTRTRKALTLPGRDRECVITVPAGCAVEALEWNIGAAELHVQAPIAAREASLSVGAGSLTADALTITGELDAEVGMGQVSLTLTGSEDGLSIDAEAGMGEISLNGRALVAGMAGEASQGRGPVCLSLQVGMGAIDIYTEEAE